MYADDVKALVVSALLPTLSLDEVLGSEVRFGEGQYRADLTIASPLRLSAFEIKGPRDNLDKLGGQAVGYSSAFLDFSVVTEEAWLNDVRSQVPRAAGLLVLRGHQLHTVRKPRPRVQLDQDAALRWLRTNELRELLRAQGLPLSGYYEAMVETARAGISAKQLSAFALESIHKRLLPRFETFRGELGTTVTLDDIRMLTLNDQVTGPLVAPAASNEN